MCGRSRSLSGISAPSPASFTSVTAQIYDTNTSTVIATQSFTLSSTMVFETITLTTGYPAADVPDLAVRLVWHQIAVAYASVQHAYAEISYSYSNSIGMLTAKSIASIPVPAPSVAPLPVVRKVAAGSVALSLTPSFGAVTIAGDLLIAWVYSNSNNVSFGTSCSDPSWLLAGHAGGQFGWVSLWYKPYCNAAETAPVFTDSGYSEPLSQLLEFSGARQPGSGYRSYRCPECDLHRSRCGYQVRRPGIRVFCVERH